MKIDARHTPLALPDAARRPETLEEAAQQFEKVLVRQFVQVMTEGMFDASLSGDDGPGWMDSQRESQHGVLTDVLTDHLVESGALRLSEMLLRQWRREQPAATDAAAEPGASLSARSLSNIRPLAR